MKHRARGWHLALLGLLAVVIPAIAFRNFNFGSIPRWSDCWDYLQLARQIQSGHGFSSLYTYPLFLKYSGTGEFFPLLWRAPLYPILLAASFILTGGPSAWAALLLQIAGFGLAVFGTYLLALEFVEPRWALLAGLVVVLSPEVLGVAEPGIATVPFTAGLTFGLLLAVRADTRKRAFWAGIYFGALMLLRGETLALFPAIIWMLWAGERGDRESRIWHFAAAGLLVILPWTLRTWLIAGRPFSTTASLLFTNTSVFPGWESTRGLDTLDHSAILWALTHPLAMTIKASKNAYHFIRQSLLMPVPALAPFVWAALGRLTRVGRESAYCAALLIAVVLLTIILSPLEYAPRFLHPFIPAVTVVGVIVLARIREELKDGGVVVLSRRPAALAAIVVIGLASLEMIGALAETRRLQASAARIPPAAVFDEIGRSVDRTGWGMADHPAYYAWFTRARYLGFPLMKDLDRVASAPGTRRTIVLVKGRGEPLPDPTGTEPTAALTDSLSRRGWSVRDVGPFVLFEDPAAAGLIAPESETPVPRTPPETAPPGTPGQRP